MRKKVRIIIFLIILILILIICMYKSHILNEEFDKDKIIEIKVIDKYDKIKEIHANPEAENYVLVDVIIDGKKYNDCGIRTKGDAIYETIKKHNTNNYSYKLKLDYRNPNQNYKGIKELHLNSSMNDPTRHKRIHSL